MKFLWTILAVLLFVGITTQPISALELRLLFEKNGDLLRSPREVELVEHTRDSYAKAMLYESKLSGTPFVTDTEIKIWDTDIPSDHLLNNLCSLEDASHLHIGLL